MLSHSNTNQSSLLRKVIKAVFILLAILVMAGLAQHLWGRWKLASVKRDMERRGQIVDLRSLPTNTVPGHTEFTNKIEQIRLAVGFSMLSGGGNQVVLPSGMAARGSQAPAPITYGATVVFTNGHAVLQSTNTNTWSDLEERYSKHAAQIAELRKLLRDPPKNMPGHYLDSLRAGTIPNFIAIRQCAQILNDTIIVELHRDNLGAAEENLIALAGFMRLYSDDPSLIPQMIRVAIEGIGTAALWDAIHEEGWSEPQLQRLQEAWTCPPTVRAVVNSLHIERLSRVETYEQMRNQSYNEWAKAYRSITQRFGIPQPYPHSLEVLRNYGFHPCWRILWAHNEMAEFLRHSDYQTTITERFLTEKNFGNLTEKWANARGKDDPIVAPQRFYLEIPYFDLTFDGFTPTSALPPVFGHILANFKRRSFDVPDFTKAVKVAAQNDVQREIAITALALKRYELGHGRLPTDLHELLPNYLKELPTDWMAGETLRYQSYSGRSYTLYSLGLNGCDDGGDPKPVAPGERETRDIVWLTPVPWRQ